MSRKTVEIEAILKMANQLLAGEGTVEFRLGVIAMIEPALFLAKRYRGFDYLTASQVPIGVEPGIIRDGTAFVKFPDPSRRKYA
jgi:hypothetical protein